MGLFSSNCYIIHADQNTAVIVDPGSPDHALMDELAKLEVKRIAVILTHRHLDHLAGVPAVYDYCRKNNIEVSLAIHKHDLDAVGKGSLKDHESDLEALGIPSFSALGIDLPDLPEADTIMEDGNIIEGYRVIHTPGHSPGSVCLYSEEHEILFSGDTLFAGSIGRTDLPGGEDRLIVPMIRKKLLVLPPNTVVYPGHGPMTSIAREIKSNPFLNGDYGS